MLVRIRIPGCSAGTKTNSHFYFTDIDKGSSAAHQLNSELGLFQMCHRAKRTNSSHIFTQGHENKLHTQASVLKSAQRVHGGSPPPLRQPELVHLPLMYQCRWVHVPLIWQRVSLLENVLSKTNEAVPSSWGMPITASRLPAGQGSGSRPPHHYQGWRGGGATGGVSKGSSVDVNTVHGPGSAMGRTGSFQDRKVVNKIFY